MSFEKAKEHLIKFGLEDKILVFEESSATVSQAAEQVKCSEAEIAKTLSFIVNDAPVLIVCAGDAKIDNSKYKKEFSQKAKMIPFESVELLTGHRAGGVCPFGINDGVAVYLDESLKRFSVVYPACGNANSAVKLTIAELEKASGYIKWIDVCKQIEA